METRADEEGELPTFPGFEVLGWVGRGGMGRIYRARQTAIDRVVALKTLHPGLAANARVARRFLREARLAARLDHPNIVALYDAGEDRGRFYLVLEFVEGPTLEALMAQGRPLPLGLVLDLGRQVAEALAHAADRGVVHRDVKPGNILVAAGQRAKLADFGLARAADESGFSRITRDGALLGTLHYVAPEQVVAAAEVDGRADVYGLGATLFHALSGRPPFAGRAGADLVRAVVDLPPGAIREARAEVPEAAAAIVRRAMAKDPEARYPHAGAMADELRAAAARLGFPVSPPPRA
ncbi:MAG: serine/threonine protein kinase [Planctomycetes bacterium]|nr:serine/threonine protein kinase [Planctomycetota bacterium]